MTFDSKPSLDEVDWHILRLLQADARLSFAELGRQVALSSPAVAERVRRLETLGVITGYHAEVDLEAVGIAVPAFISLTVPADKYSSFITLVKNLPEVLECHHVTGEVAFVLKVGVRSVSHLEKLVAQLGRYGSTSSAIILSSPLVRREIGQVSGAPIRE